MGSDSLVGTPLRVGSVPYLVARPLDLGLEREPGIAYRTAAPARLVEGLRSGELDLALVSAVELFRRPGYGYLRGPAVAGRGFVSSVQVFLRRPLAEVSTLALDPSSRAAATLVRVVLDPAFGAPCARPGLRYVDPEAGGDPREAVADAWLRIGDRALHEFLAPDAPPVLNPSQVWTERTGLPFAFAVWVLRPGLELGRQALQALARARARGTAALLELAEEAAYDWGLPPEACRRYLAEECVYDLGEELEPALLAFRDAAAALGLCAADLRPRGLEVDRA